jgi:hypothetical protein
MNLLKQSPLNEKYRHPAMEGLASLLRVSRGFKNLMHGIRVVGTICMVSR